ncbi:hypothetical protein [Paenibacillus sp. 1001270B_150601_E10]|uniref:hypothetical protein n=1 Tax=Paenibacillus sp. 1001270B_150601_E10 TaxID=2787079 RepID=UPI001E6070F0|nr:hypothetical protein [Paenibacillus sp. 1001270B_150601_E10]
MMKRKWLSLMLTVAALMAILPVSVASAQKVPAHSYSTSAQITKSIAGQGRLSVYVDAYSMAPPEYGPVLWYQYEVRNSAGQIIYSNGISQSPSGSLNNLPYDTYTVNVWTNQWTGIAGVYLNFY